MKKTIKRNPSSLLTASITYIWRRFFTGIFIAACIAFAGMQLGWASHPHNTSYVTVYVREGDTIWDYANLAADSHTDVRQVMCDIMTVNDLPGNAQIHPGQVLKIPVSPERAEQVKKGLP